MAANGKPSAIPKNKVRVALVTAATAATLISAQILALSQGLKDNQNQQTSAAAANAQSSNQQVVVVPYIEPSPTPMTVQSQVPTQIVQPTAQSAQVVAAAQQPAPSTRSSRR